MTSHQPPARDGRAPGRPWPSAPAPVRAAGYAGAAWCLGFAGVSAWQVAADLTGRPDPHQRYAAYASGLAVMWVLVGVLKLAARPRPWPRSGSGPGGRAGRWSTWTSSSLLSGGGPVSMRTTVRRGRACG